MDGVDGVYSVQKSDEGADVEVRQGIDLADAAKRVRLSHLVYSSVAAADQKTGIPHFESKARVEDHIRNTGLRYTILRPVFFMENLFMMRDSIEAGKLSLPLSPDTRLEMIAVDDIGEFAALAFLKPGHWQGRAIEIAGDELSMTDLAQTLSRHIGHEVAYSQTPWDEFEQRAGHEMTLMYRWFESHGYSVAIPPLRQEHAGLKTLQQWLQTAWRARVQTA